MKYFGKTFTTSAGSLGRALTVVACVIAMSSVASFAQVSSKSRGKDPLSSLKRSITLAGGPALSTSQSTAIIGEITAYKSTRTRTLDPTLSAAYDALDTAILAGDQATIQAQVAVISARKAELGAVSLQAVADFEVAVVSILRTGGQLDRLTSRYGNYRTLEIIGDLIDYDSHHDDDDEDDD